MLFVFRITFLQSLFSPFLFWMLLFYLHKDKILESVLLHVLPFFFKFWVWLQAPDHKTDLEFPNLPPFPFWRHMWHLHYFSAMVNSVSAPASQTLWINWWTSSWNVAESPLHSDASSLAGYSQTYIRAVRDKTQKGWWHFYPYLIIHISSKLALINWFCILV